MKPTGTFAIPGLKLKLKEKYGSVVQSPNYSPEISKMSNFSTLQRTDKIRLLEKMAFEKVRKRGEKGGA